MAIFSPVFPFSFRFFAEFILMRLYVYDEPVAAAVVVVVALSCEARKTLKWNNLWIRVNSSIYGVLCGVCGHAKLAHARTPPALHFIFGLRLSAEKGREEKQKNKAASAFSVSLDCFYRVCVVFSSQFICTLAQCGDSIKCGESRDSCLLLVFRNCQA